MKVASFPRFALFSLLAALSTLVLGGCGASNNLALMPGNWSMTATPSGASPFYIGGNLTQNGSALTGTMYVVNSNCFTSSTTVVLSGTIHGQNVTLSSTSISGQVIAITATGTASALTGTYTVTGGCDDGDSGSLSASIVPSISATWSGPIASQGGSNVTLALSLTQTATASGDGTFALTGNGVFTNSSCSNTASVTDAFIAGPYLVVNALTDDGGEFSYTQVLLNNAATPTSMNGTYEVFGGNCDGDLDNPTFTKQQ
jgi:hypothetical protein